MPKRTGTDRSAKQLTPRQITLAENFVKGTTITEAARRAGYSGKNLAQSGHQAFKAIKRKAPEVMARAGLNLDTVIRKHLDPLLNATETKIFQSDGKITDYVEVNDNTTRLGATRIALELLGAFPSEEEKHQANFGIEVLILDVPRPDRSAINITPINGRKPVQSPDDNGAKPGSRPEQ
jgi:hypothetical protein